MSVPTPEATPAPVPAPPLAADGPQLGSAVGSGADVRGLGAGLLSAVRPRQWIKNVLVLGAPAAAGTLLQGATLARALAAFVSFSLLASGTYLLNDAADRDRDRCHPLKRLRPIASGVVPRGLAVVAGVTLLGAGLVVAWVVSLALLGTAMAYVALTASYTLWLKHVAILDLAAVAGSYILRAVAGGAATQVGLSRWFLIVVSFGALFVVAGKRHSEHLALGPGAAAARATLATYSVSFLRYVWTMASTVCATAYCLWAFAQSHRLGTAPWAAVSIVPFALAILRYAFILDSGGGDAPEDVMLTDRPLLIIGLVWLVVFASGIYLGR